MASAWRWGAVMVALTLAGCSSSSIHRSTLPEPSTTTTTAPAVSTPATTAGTPLLGLVVQGTAGQVSLAARQSNGQPDEGAGLPAGPQKLPYTQANVGLYDPAHPVTFVVVPLGTGSVTCRVEVNGQALDVETGDRSVTCKS